MYRIPLPCLPPPSTSSPARRSRRLIKPLAVLTLLACGASAAETVITIESWRSEDQAIWDEKILPVFEAQYPEIDVQFTPTTPTEYNAALNTRLAGGTAGDVIVCRPFDVALALHQEGHLADIKDLPGLQENFSDVARAAWSTDDGSASFCVPMASVIHGFMYNKDAFAELGVEVPTTLDEFYSVLDTIKEDGSYIPLAMGTKDQWEAATMGYLNVGPTFWNGEEGRNAVLSGEAKLTDEPYVQAFAEMQKWTPYLGNGYQAQGYTDSQNLFTLGRAAIYPTGSWEITGFQANSDFELGAFAPPKATADGTCHISDHTDIGIGMNAATENADAVKTFLEWTTSQEFASLLTNAAPGFFSLSSHNIEVENPLAAEFIAMRNDCESTIRLAHQILARGEPALDTQLWTLTANVINGTMTPEEAATAAQENLDSWFEPL